MGLFATVGFQDRCLNQFEPTLQWRGREDSNLQALVLRGTTSLANWPFYQLRHCHMALGPGLEPGWGFHRRRISSAVPYHFRTAKHGGVDRARTCAGFIRPPPHFQCGTFTNSVTTPYRIKKITVTINLCDEKGQEFCVFLQDRYA